MQSFEGALHRAGSDRRGVTGI